MLKKKVRNGQKGRILMGIGNRVLEMSELFKEGDKVKILPNKGYGTITKITPEGFIFLGKMNHRPYMPNQLEKIDEIPRNSPVRKTKKQKSFWKRFWFERPHPLADEDTPQDFFMGMAFALTVTFVFWFIVFGIVFLVLSI